MNDIHNQIDKYKILTAVWPAKGNQSNTQNNNYEPNIHQANVKYNNNNKNYNKFSTNDQF